MVRSSIRVVGTVYPTYSDHRGSVLAGTTLLCGAAVGDRFNGYDFRSGAVLLRYTDMRAVSLGWLCNICRVVVCHVYAWSFLGARAAVHYDRILFFRRDLAAANYVFCLPPTTFTSSPWITP